MTTTETISGVIEARTERGIKVQGRWASISKFKPLEVPEVGAHVALGLDSKGFIVSIEILDDLSQLSDAPANAQVGQRLEVLRIAAAFGASRPDCKSSDVLAIAQRWLQWVEAGT